MKLFDPIERTNTAYKSNAQPHYSYLNESALPEQERVRVLLEQWFRDYATTDQALSLAGHDPNLRKKLYEVRRQLRGRFRSKNKRQHWGAFFELYCRALLHAQNFTVEAEPLGDVSNDTKIEFLAYADGAPCFYLEATIILGDETMDGSYSWLDQQRDAFNELVSPNFYLSMEVTRIPPASAHPPSTDGLRKFVQKQLAERDPDEMLAKMKTEGRSAMSLEPWKKDGWTITLALIPVSPERRMLAMRGTLGLTSYPAQWAYDADVVPLLNGLKRKANKYGSLDQPFVISVNVVNTISEDSIKEALISQRFFQDHPGVSAVLVISGLVPRAVASETPVLWHNPWAEKPLDRNLWQGHQIEINDTRTLQGSFIRGKTGTELFHLHAEWPHGG